MAVSEAETAYQKALKKFEENLSAKQMSEVQRPTTLNELCDIAEQISRRHENKKSRKTIRVYEKLNNVRERIKPFDKLLEALCESAPTGGKFIWGAVRFTFELVEGNYATFLAILDFFTGIGDKLSIIRTELESFKESALVTSIGEKIFSVLLDFWTQAIQKYHKLRFRLLDPGGYALRQKFARLQSDLDEKVALMKDAANAQHHHNFEKLSSGFHKHIRDEHDKRIFDLIGTPNYLLDLNKADKKRHDGTCEWILNNDIYRRYVSPTSSANILITYGIPGAGKTILSSFIIKHTKNLASAIGTPGKIPLFVAFHFFKADDDTKNTPITSLRSLLHQVYEFALDAQIEGIKCLFQAASRKRNVDYADLWSLLISIVKSKLLDLTVVLDALDECVGIKSFAKAIVAILPCKNLKIFATSRKSGGHVGILHGSGIEIVEMTPNDVSKDIASYVRYKVDKMYNLNTPKFKRLRTRVIDELSKQDNHNGMFLWAYLMCKEIKNQGTVGEIQRLLQERPQDMREVYINILTRLNEKSAASQTFIQHVFRWVVGSIRPLKWAELDQALEINRFCNEYYEDDDDYGDTNIYSRRDIVKACGSLVHYTGLDDGDVIGLIHLSAREFLKSSAAQMEGFPKALEKYLVNDTDVGVTITLRCLNVLSSPSVQSREYSQQLYKQKSTIRTVTFEESPLFGENPLFEYSVLYWPEYIDVLQADDGESIPGENTQNLSDLWTMLGQFLASSCYVSWLEGYLLLCGIELTSHAINRLLKLELSKISPEINQLIMETSRSLRIFKGVGSIPTAARFCIPTIRNGGKSQLQSLHVPTSSKDELEEHRPIPQGNFCWMAYDHRSRSVFLTTLFNYSMEVIRRRTDGEIAFRPARMGKPSDTFGMWNVVSAALKQDATYLAVTFKDHGSFYKTVCWSVSNSRDANAAAPWAQTIIVEETEASIFRDDWDVNRGALVAFGENNTLISPGGIRDLATTEKLPSPDSIWCANEPKNIRDTCFSPSRAARIRNEHYLEILELFDGENHKGGHLVGSYDIAVYVQQPKRLEIQQFSPRGDKVILRYRQANPDIAYLLFIIDSDGKGDLTQLGIGRGIMALQFTSDEQRVIGQHKAEGREGSDICMWSIQKRSTGHETFADMVILWKASSAGATVAITPPLPTERMGGILIALSDGRLVKRSLTQQWTDEEESQSGIGQYVHSTLSQIDSAGTTLFRVSFQTNGGSTNTLVFEAWSIEGDPMLRFPIIRHDAPADLVNSLGPKSAYKNDAGALRMSNDNSFIAVKEHLFHLSDKGVLFTLPRITQGVNRIDVQFDSRSHHFATIERRESAVMIELYEIETNEKLRRLASHLIEGGEGFKPGTVKVALAGTHDLVFAYTYLNVRTNDKFRVAILEDGGLINVDGCDGRTCVAIVEDGEVTTADVCDKYFSDLSFSQCGRYIYHNHRSEMWPKLYPISSVLPLGEACFPHYEYPTIMKCGLYYLCASYLYVMRTEGGLVYLKRKHIDGHGEGEKDIGIIPYLNQDVNKNRFFTILPQDPTGEIKIVVTPRERIEVHPIVITTRITVEDLLNESGWIDDDSL